MQHRLFAARNRGNRAADAAHPDRVLIFDLARIIQHPFFAETRRQRCHSRRAHFDHKFSAFEFGPEKILPPVRHLVRGNQVLAVGEAVDRAGEADDVAVCRINNFARKLEHSESGHPQDIEFLKLRQKVLIQFLRDLKDVPVASPGLQFERKPGEATGTSLRSRRNCIRTFCRSLRNSISWGWPDSECSSFRAKLLIRQTATSSASPARSTASPTARTWLPRTRCRTGGRIFSGPNSKAENLWSKCARREWQRWRRVSAKNGCWIMRARSKIRTRSGCAASAARLPRLRAANRRCCICPTTTRAYGQNARMSPRPWSVS